jgi:hypothetical protein
MWTNSSYIVYIFRQLLDFISKLNWHNWHNSISKAPAFYWCNGIRKQMKWKVKCALTSNSSSLCDYYTNNPPSPQKGKSNWMCTWKGLLFNSDFPTILYWIHLLNPALQSHNLTLQLWMPISTYQKTTWWYSHEDYGQNCKCMYFIQRGRPLFTHTIKLYYKNLRYYIT